MPVHPYAVDPQPEHPNFIRPGVWVRDEYGYERLVYPTGAEYLLAFALAGCPWAVNAWEEWVADEGNRWAGDGI